MTRHPRLRVLLTTSALMAVACASEIPRTQVMVTIDAESAIQMQASRLVVAVRGGSQTDPSSWQASEPLEFVVDAGPSSWPVLVALVPSGGDTSRRYEVVATAYGASSERIVSAEVISGFRRGETLHLALILRDRCATDPMAGECAAREIDPSDLPPWSGAPDAGATTDAGTSDATLPDAGPRDAASDAPDADGMAAECVTVDDCATLDDEPCWSVACVEGRCAQSHRENPCDDGDPCTIGDVCREGTCSGAPIVCGTNETCAVGVDPDVGACLCVPGAVRCGDRCIVGDCCPGTVGGTCGNCGQRRCTSGATWTCENQGECSAGATCFTNEAGGCMGCNAGQSRACNNDCRWGGCFP